MAELREFPLPSLNVALLDLDATLIDSNYQYTTPLSDVREAILGLQNTGWTVGLSSDTPHAVMAQRKEELGMNGPIIAEKGAVVDINGTLHYDVNEARLFANAYMNTRRALVTAGFEVWEGDPVNAIANNDQVGTPGRPLVLMNKYRICSLGLFARQVTRDGTMVLDHELTSEIVGLAQLPGQGELEGGVDIDANSDYGLLIAKGGDVSKRNGTLRYLGLSGLSGSVAMIGDSMGDFLGDGFVHYAVANARPEFKAKANYVAAEPITKGAIEILGKLQR